MKEKKKSHYIVFMISSFKLIGKQINNGLPGPTILNLKKKKKKR